MTAVLSSKDNVNGQVLYMALELSDKRWKLRFSNGEKERQVTIESGDWSGLRGAVREVKKRLRIDPEAQVYSCYEAGRDGFWIHRGLAGEGIRNEVIDSSSIEVSRRKRRAKTDGVDVKGLLRLLQRHLGGEKGVLKGVRVPTQAAEDGRRLHRERDRLLKERGSHSARMKSLLVTQGIRLKFKRDFEEQLEQAKGLDGEGLGTDLKGELKREYERYRLVDAQVKALEAEQRRRVLEGDGKEVDQIRQLMLLKSIGQQSSWILVKEFFGWRAFRNRRQVGSCAGLVPTPYNSGDSEREQGISKAGNDRVRKLMVELSWLWLRYQPGSQLSQWYRRRYGGGGKRMRRIGIVALARKLLVALWKYLSQGEIPEGAVLKAG